ncbi:MAG: ABC transporter permease [Clostridiaceae bacterium]|nr:ABC transporter permease [Clostridiaceae bacterium]
MLNYIVRRVLQGVLLVVAVSLMVCLLLNMMPGDPVDSLVSEQVSDEKKAELRHEWGLDQPWWVQYWKWADRALHGDLGNSLNTNLNILDSLRSRLPISVKLCGVAMVCQLAFSVPLGLIAAYRQGGWFDRFIMGYSMVTAAIPTFWIGMVLILIFGIAFAALPVSGYATWRHYVLPVAAMVLGGVSSNIRLTRSEVLGVIREKYVTTAYAKGLGERVVMYRHVLRNALILVVVSTFMSLPWIVAGAVVMEKVFAMPGMGAWMVDAVVATDFPVVQACLLVISVLVVISNLFGDIFSAVLDPRIRASISGGAV